MRAPWIIVLLVAVTCCGTSKTSKHPDAYRGIVLRTDGPRGGVLTDPNGTELEYRIFRVHVLNDSTVPVELTMGLQGGAVALLPDTSTFISVFLLPDELCPDTAQDVINFGITEAEAFIRARSSGTTSLRTTVQPGEDHLLYIGVTFAPHDLGGLGRAELFIDGQKPDPSIFPDGSVPVRVVRGKDLELILGVAIDPPEHYVLVPCGWVAFTK